MLVNIYYLVIMPGFHLQLEVDVYIVLYNDVFNFHVILVVFWLMCHTEYFDCTISDPFDTIFFDISKLTFE